MADPKLTDLDAYTIAELEQLAVRVTQEIARKRAVGRAWLREHGTRISEAEAPMYQNPNNAAQTWSGKGKQPRWVELALAEGKTLDSLASNDMLPAPMPSRRDVKREK